MMLPVDHATSRIFHILHNGEWFQVTGSSEFCGTKLKIGCLLAEDAVDEILASGSACAEVWDVCLHL